MKGFAMLGIGKAGWIEKERPVCGPLDAIVKPLALSPCTSDIHTVWEGALGDRHNMILGHEGCGVFGEYFHVNDADANLAFLPDSITPEEACMLSDMVPTGFHGVELADVQFGDTVLVNGIGPVGLMSVAGANLRGASRIICVGTRPACREAAKKYGATDFISYKEGPIDQQVMELTKGAGVDKVVVAGGGVESFEAMIKALKPGGKIGNVNYLGSGDFVTIPRVEWGCGMGHKQIVGGLMPGGRLRLQKLASLVECGKLNVKHLITHRFEGFEKVEDALMLMKDKPADLIKPVVKISD